MKASVFAVCVIAAGTTAAQAEGPLPRPSHHPVPTAGTVLAALGEAGTPGYLLRSHQGPRRPRPAVTLVAAKRNCNPQKYHGPGVVIEYDPDNFKHTPEYLRYRDPNMPSRAETARIAEERFAELVTPKVIEMLRLVNRVRRSHGQTEMKLEPRLTLAAKRHNIDIARHALMQHTGTDCSQLKDRVWDAGYTWTKIAENLAGGNESATVTLAQWTGSSRHLEQMTLPYMTDAGLAYDYNPNPPRNGLPIKHFWTLILARPDPWRDRRDLPERFEDEINGNPQSPATKRSTRDERKS